MAENFATDQFSLRWNNFTNNLTSGFMSHLSDKDLVDVTLAVDGQLLQAHKLVLSVCSPYFKDIFKSNPCRHPIVILPDMGYAQVESLLRFMYQGEVNVRQEELASFLKVAEILQIKGLTSEGSDNRDDCVKEEEDRGSSLSENSKFNQDRDDEESREAAKQTVDPIALVRKRRSRNSTVRASHSTKRSRTCIPDLKDLDAAVTTATNVEAKGLLLEDEENNDAKPLTELNSDDFVDDNSGIFTDDSIDLTKELEEKNDQFIYDDTTKEDNSGPVVEPVTYRLSARGRPQLVHAGYVYNLTSRSEALNRSHYRCAEQHRGCHGKCAVIAERFMPTGVHEHNHAPGYRSENDYRKKKGLDSEQN